MKWLSIILLVIASTALADESFNAFIEPYSFADLRSQPADRLTVATRTLEAAVYLSALGKCRDVPSTCRDTQYFVSFRKEKPINVPESMPWPTDGAIVILERVAGSGTDLNNPAETACTERVSQHQGEIASQNGESSYARFFIDDQPDWSQFDIRGDTPLAKKMSTILGHIIIAVAYIEEFRRPNGVVFSTTEVLCIGSAANHVPPTVIETRRIR